MKQRTLGSQSNQNFPRPRSLKIMLFDNLLLRRVNELVRERVILHLDRNSQPSSLKRKECGFAKETNEKPSKIRKQSTNVNNIKQEYSLYRRTLIYVMQSLRRLKKGCKYQPSWCEIFVDEKQMIASQSLLENKPSLSEKLEIPLTALISEHEIEVFTSCCVKGIMHELANGNKYKFLTRQMALPFNNGAGKGPKHKFGTKWIF